MTIILIVLGFLLLIGFLIWANDRMEAANERLEREIDPNLKAVAEHAWKGGKVTLGTVDEDGNLKIEEVDNEQRNTREN